MTISVREFSRWGEAGLTGLDPDTLDRWIAGEGWPAPDDVALDGVDRLTWTNHKGRRVQAGRGLLTGFVKLWDEPASEVLRFARKWGVLEICQHGVPRSHDVWTTPIGHVPGLPLECLPLREGDSWDRLWEPVSAWKQLAAEFRAILNLSGDLDHGHGGRREDWMALRDASTIALALAAARGARSVDDLLVASGSLDWDVVSDRTGAGRDVMVSRSVIAGLVDTRLRWGKARMTLAWAENTPSVSLTGVGLFGALAIQLLLSVGRIKGLAECAGCGVPHVPHQPPRPGRRIFCLRCRELKIPAALAARDYRIRLKGKLTSNRADEPLQVHDRERRPRRTWRAAKQ